MESCWTHGDAAYRCRHGHTSSRQRDLEDQPNTYLREAQLLAQLPALWLRLTHPHGLPAPGDTTIPTAEEATASLRAAGRTLIYDANTRTLTADTDRREKIRIT
jgi:hypothetical protein